MLDGWYCRTMSNLQNTSNSTGSAAEHSQNANFSDSDEDEQQQQNQRQRKLSNLSISAQQHQHHLQRQKVDYKTQYLSLKKKLKYLIYENEFFQDTLRSSQRRLLKVSRDRSFLLDRLLQYEKNEISSSESDETESSDDDGKTENVKRKKLENSNNNQSNNNNNVQNNNAQTQNKVQNSGTTSAASKPPRKRAAGKKSLLQMNENTTSSATTTTSSPIVTTIDGHMTPDEVARHLQSRHSLMELVSERAPPTVPNEMFSNEPSLDSESNDQIIVTSPNNLGEECIDLNIMQD